ncbi:EFR1 family ferrodoxin [Methanobacterium sp.]|uniref:EFR1 family ferrodoxin n=1 Tax=Methanobacterium sp. TaxID=2164 RepID=UPI003C719E85
MKDIDFYFFSGTGNTLLVVNKMRDIFEENGINVNLHKIEQSNPDEINLEHIIGIGFPVAVLSTYPFVWNFIKTLPDANGTDIFMVDTLAGLSGGIVGPLREIVKKKGYTPIGAMEIKMPPNIFFIQDEIINRIKVENGLKEAEEYAKNIINEKAEWGRVPILSDAINLFSMGALRLTGIDLHQKFFLFNLDKDRCNKCGICVGLCPTKNIKINDGEYPVHGLNCHYCLRCTSFCPKNAIPCKFNYKGKTYSAVKAKEFLKIKNL